MSKTSEGLPVPGRQGQTERESDPVRDLVDQRLAKSMFYQKHPQAQREIRGLVLDSVERMLAQTSSLDEGWRKVMDEAGIDEAIKATVQEWGLPLQAASTAVKGAAREIYLAVRGGFRTIDELRAYREKLATAGPVRQGGEFHTDEVAPPTTKRTTLRRK